uniref:Uncharacterized protein n=1 Tax=Cacopsylla melanoneura TaxID=428564 RepID=A0A8D8Q7U4_9HEMI
MSHHGTRVAVSRTTNSPGTGDMVAPATPSSPMALFGMVWLLRLRSELRQCSQCRSDAHQRAHHRNNMMPGSSNAPIFTVDGSAHPAVGPDLTFCQVHGYVSHPSKEGKWPPVMYIVLSRHIIHILCAVLSFVYEPPIFVVFLTAQGQLGDSIVFDYGYSRIAL